MTYTSRYFRFRHFPFRPRRCFYPSLSKVKLCRGSRIMERSHCTEPGPGQGPGTGPGKWVPICYAELQGTGTGSGNETAPLGVCPASTTQAMWLLTIHLEVRIHMTYSPTPNYKYPSLIKLRASF